MPLLHATASPPAAAAWAAGPAAAVWPPAIHCSSPGRIFTGLLLPLQRRIAKRVGTALQVLDVAARCRHEGSPLTVPFGTWVRIPAALAIEQAKRLHVVLP